jgi:hypothetical protein
MLAKPPATGNDMAAVGNRSRAGYFLGLWGPFVPLTDVEAIGFEMEEPVGSPTLELRQVRLERKSPGDAVLDGMPVIDELGQYAHGAWPGKARSVGDLTTAWRDEDRALVAGDFGFCPYGGFTDTKAGATGFFRVEKRDARWWFVDPDGHLFLSLGADVIRPEMVTPVAGREAFFRQRPPRPSSPRASATATPAPRSSPGTCCAASAGAGPPPGSTTPCAAWTRGASTRSPTGATRGCGKRGASPT